MKLPLLATSLVALSSIASADVHVLHASLDGAQEVPPTATLGSGEATITVDDVSGLVHVQGTHTNLGGNLTAAHLHGLAATGSNAGVLFALDFSGNSFEGSATLSAADVAGVLDGLSYVNLHTTAIPSGEVRGQADFDDVIYTGLLDAAQSGTSSNGDGTYTVEVDRNTNLVTVSGTYNGLTSALNSAHLHGPAWFGQGGSILINLTHTGGTAGTYTGDATLTDAEIDHILDGFTYVNLHTTTFPPGELRGQVSPPFLGTPYCRAADNSTGVAGILRAAGSPRAMDNDVMLSAMSLPTNSFGFVIASRSSGQTFPVTNSDGRICVVGPNIGRFGSTIQSSGPTGEMSATIDIMNIPGNPPQSAMAGDVFNFQIWHRDSSGGVATSNFTNAVSISFR